MAEAEEGDGAQSKGVEEKALEVEWAEEGQEKAGEQGRQTEEQVWQDVHQIQIQGRIERWWYQGQEGPGRERREVGGGHSARQESTGRMGTCARGAGAGDGVCGGARGYGEG